jgi:hypothetical protein
MNMKEIEAYFKQRYQELGELANQQEFQMVFYLLNKAKKLEWENDKLTALNRHYLFTFFDGDVSRMAKAFEYLQN